MWNFIKKVIDFIKGDMKINVLSHNTKIENKIDNSPIHAPVQQAQTIVNQFPVDRISKITEESKLNLLDKLKGYPIEKFKIFRNSGDPEVESFSKAISAMLEQADWELLGDIINLGSTYPDGLNIRVKEVNSARQALADWFVSRGSRVVASKAGQDDFIEIFIGRNR